TIVDRPSAVQTNITITAPVVLTPGDMDNFPVSVMNQILGGGVTGWLFQDLREKHGYTYGAYSSISNDPIVGSFSASAAVRTAVTDSALMRFIYELNRIRNEKVAEIKLDSVKNQLSGNFALSLERPSQIAQFALNLARYNMPADYYKNYLKSIAAVTPDDIERAAQKYITPEQVNIVLVGNAKEFAPYLSPFGKVRYVDIYGNPVAAP
ncbi:MAG: insulinase family protein, partial [Chitinophagaceae bacterium]